MFVLLCFCVLFCALLVILSLLLVIMGGQHDELFLFGSPPILYIYVHMYIFLMANKLCCCCMHLKTLKMIATSGFLTGLECTKFVFGRDSAPGPAGGAHDAPPDPLVGWGGGYPLPIPHPLDVFGVSVSVS